ncbi:MAG TPA: HYR domain-containing protein, partial [Chitinophagales bacterium]|nr:HYR domain-containing protein [Chitinophagales bacterium]
GTATNWASVSAGDYHTLATKSDGSLWAWGDNFYGQLGRGNYTTSNSPVQVGTATNWASVSAGGYHTLATKTDDGLWAWGRNVEGQLGTGNNTDSTSPVQVSSPVPMGSTISSSKTVTVSTPPTPGITNNTGTTVLTCAITSISVTATGGTSYAWSGGSTPTTAANTFTTTGTYTVTVTGTGGCTATASINLTGNNTPPTPGITNNTGTTILTCTTPSISVTATGGDSYQWSGGSTPTTAANTFTTAGTYTVTVTTGSCTATTSLIISYTPDTTSPTVTCPTPQTIYTDNNGAGDCTAGYAMPNPMADNCPGGTWGVAFSGNPVSNPNAISNLPNGFNIEYIVLQKGATQLTYTATDAGGNPATPCTYTVTVIDNEAPLMYCTDNLVTTTDSNGTGDCTGVYTIMNPLADNCPGATWGAAFTNNTNGLPANFGGIAEGSNSAPFTVYAGTTTVTLSAIDAQGNLATTCSFTLSLIDNEAPVLNCPTNQLVNTGSNGTGDCTGVFAISSPLADNCMGATWNVLFSGNPNGIPANMGGLAAGSSSGSVTYQIGTTNVTLTANDAAGNMAAACSFVVTLQDNEAPALNCPTNQTVYTASNPLSSCTGLYAIANPMTDNCMGGTWSANFSNNTNGLPNPLLNNAIGSGSGNIAFSLGTTTVTLSAADAASNNANTCSFTVQVIDNRPPAITCPPAITAPTTTGVCSANVSFLLPIATDDCTALPTVTANPVSGSSFGLGETTVILTATDAANNAATCS